MEDALQIIGKLVQLAALTALLFVADAAFGAERASPAPATPSGAQITVTNGEMEEMHAAIQNLEKEMEIIHATVDPAERQRLMNEHIAKLRGIMVRARETLNKMTRIGAPALPPGIGDDNSWPWQRMAELYTRMLQSMINQIMQHLEMMSRQKAN